MGGLDNLLFIISCFFRWKHISFVFFVLKCFTFFYILTYEHGTRKEKIQKAERKTKHYTSQTNTQLHTHKEKKTKIARVIATDFAGNLDFVRNSERPYIKTDSVTWLRGSGA